MEFPADLKPKTMVLHFDADTAARIINAALLPFKLMSLIAGICGLRIGEVTALKITSLDFKRKVININSALDYSTRQETSPKTPNGVAPIPMPHLLEKYLRDWVEKHNRPNDAGYLFTNSRGKPYRSDYVIKVLHRRLPNSESRRRKESMLGFTASATELRLNCWNQLPSMSLQSSCVTAAPRSR